MAVDEERKRATSARWRAANKDKIAKHAKDYRTAHKDKLDARAIAYNRFKKTGVTQEQYDGAYLKQKGVCAICSLPCAQGISLAADHCHTTGIFRGLLCGSCNLGLGKFKDNKLLLENAIQYLKETQ
jgi:hypothetical protein